MRDSRRAELPDGACRMGKVGSMGPGSERYGERAGLEWGCEGARGGLRSPPLRSRRGYGLHGASVAAQGRARCGASGDTGNAASWLAPYAGQPPRCLPMVSFE